MFVDWINFLLENEIGSNFCFLKVFFQNKCSFVEFFVEMLCAFVLVMLFSNM